MGQIRHIQETSFRQLFKDSFYVIPTYQRVYSWDDYNLEALWEDILSVKGGGMVPSSNTMNNHFMSSVLVKEISTYDTNLGKTRLSKHIVDGQQRMTTIFLFCHAALDVLDINQKSFKDSFYRMIRKELIDVLYGEDFTYDSETGEAEQVRISRLTLQNRDESHPFNLLIANGASTWTQEHKSTKVAQAYLFFKKKLQLALRESNHTFKVLIDVTLDNLHLIYIPIMEQEAPQKIFESVNGLTKKLYAGELIKNFLLLSVFTEEDSLSVYQNYWAEFDKSIWTENDQNKEDLTKYLYYWVMSMGHKIKTNDESVYRGFKKVSGLPRFPQEESYKQVKKLSEDIKRSILTLTRLEETKESPTNRLELSYSRLYSMKDALNSKCVFIQFLRVINNLENHFGQLTSEQYNKLLLPLESYIIRKSLSAAKYSGATTDFLLGTVSQVFRHPAETTYKTIDDYLNHKVKDFCQVLASTRDASKRYDSTEYLLDYLTGNRDKGLFPKEIEQSYHGMVKMLLIQVENHLNSDSLEMNKPNINGTTSLERWLPQHSSAKTWPLKNEPSRGIYINSIGNLTIIPESVSSQLSDNSLVEKLEKAIDILDGPNQHELHTFNKLLDLCIEDAGDSAWNEDKIDKRAQWLVGILLNNIFKDIEYFTGKKRAEVQLKNIWDEPQEGRRIVAKVRETLVRGYQKSNGSFVIDEAINLEPITKASLTEYQKEKREAILAECTVNEDGTYHWTGEIESPNKTSWLAVFTGTRADIWVVED